MYLIHTPVIKCLCKCIAKRHIVMIFCLTGFTLSFILRMCLVFTLTEVVKPYVSNPKVDPNGCPTEDTPSDRPIEKLFLYQWPSTAVGHVMAAIFYGSMSSQLLGGLLSDKYGGKIILTVGVFFSSVSTVLTPHCFEAGYLGVIVVRVIHGFFQGFAYMALHVMQIRWVPLNERAVCTTLVFSGTILGNILNSIITPHLTLAFGKNFAYTYYIYGLVGFLWVILFVLFCGSDPDHDQFLSEKERDTLEENMATSHGRVRKSIFGDRPWKYILTSAPVWSCIIATFGFNWFMSGISHQLPHYTKFVFHLNVAVSGYVILIFYTSILIVALVSSTAVDYIQRKRLMSTTANRKLFFSVTSFLPVLGLLAPLLGCNVPLVLGLMLAGFAFAGCFYPSLKANFFDLSPRYVGTVSGFGHTIAVCAGIICNSMYGYIVPNNHWSEWQLNFGVINIVYFVSSVIFLIWGSGEVQHWNDL